MNNCDDGLFIPSSQFQGIEETTFETNVVKKTREEVLEFLNLMKDRTIHSIKNETPLSELHRQLHMRIDLPFRQLFDWREEHFPQKEFPEMRLMDFETRQEMADILSQWYLECHSIKIPIYQHSEEDYEYSSHWQQKSMDYATKVLQPVLNELILQVPEIEIDLTTHKSSRHFSEDMCVTWGGHLDGIELVNTCSIDNFITLLNLHHDTISEALELLQCSPSLPFRNALSLINTRRFDQLKVWIAQMLEIKVSNYQYNFLGYEGQSVHLLCKD